MYRTSPRIRRENPTVSQGRDFILRWLEGCCYKKKGFWLLSDARGRLQIAHCTLWPTSRFSQRKAKRLYKGSTHPLLPQLVVYYFSSPLSFCFKKKKKERKRKKHGTKSNVRPLLSPHRHTSKEIWAVSQSLLKSYISPPIMYIKRLFSLPQWRRLFSQSCLSVPELVTYCVSTFPFLPLISASSFAGVVLIRTQHSTLQWRLCPWKGVFIRHKRFVKKQWKKKETLNVCIIKGESRCRERKE